MGKKHLLIILLIIYAIFISAAFGLYVSNHSGKKPKVITKTKVITRYVTAKSNDKSASNNDNSKSTITSKNEADLESKNWTVTEEYSTDIDNDGNKETIKLQVNAEKDKNGKIAWNDGQKWALNVYKDNKVYNLFEKFLQMGEYHIIVGSSSDGNSIKIGLLNINQCGLSLKAFKYNKTNSEFISLPSSSSIDFNQTMFSGVPYMQ